MDDPNIIATLIASGMNRAERAFQFEHNKHRYEAPTNDIRPFSRETTPYSGDDSQDGNPKDKDATSNRLKLSFDRPPKNVSKGYVFGWGPDCDIQLVDREDLRPGDREQVGMVSRKHFSITFDAERRVVLRDASTNRTAVSYDGQAGNELRRHFTWIIFPDFEKIEVSIPSADISFIIKLGTHKNCDKEYRANMDRVFPPSVRMRESGLATPFQQLNVHSKGTSVAPSGSATPRDRPIYLRHERIGKGAFGRVYRVTNVSTGDDYAAKYIDYSDCAREVAVMEKIDHEHIVRFVEYRETPTPVIFMEFLSMGSLDDVHAASPITFEETLAVLVQGLQALEYLKSCGVMHRDLKPANILVSSRSPLIIIKLADLGLAKDDRNGSTKFKTRVGSPLYIAPEVWKGKKEPYTYAADIWSLGVVALQLAYGLPDPKSGNWFCKILDFVKALDSDQLIDFLSSSMLRPEPMERLPASQCLEEAIGIQLEVGLEKAMQSPLTRNASQLGFGTPTEKASMLTTLMWEPSSKRQRSPHSGGHATSTKRTAIRQERDDQTESDYSHIYPIADASLWFDGQHGPMCESVLKLLKDMQIDGDGATDSRTFELVRALCQKLKQLQITEIEKSFDLDAEQTILMAITETKAFPLASLTSSDLANSVDELAVQLLRMADLLAPDFVVQFGDQAGRLSTEDGGDAINNSSMWNLLHEVDYGDRETNDGATTPTRALPFPSLHKSSESLTNELDSWHTDRSRGITFPSAASDVLNVSGCTIPV